MKTLLLLFNSLTSDYDEEWSGMERLLAANVFFQSIQAQFNMDQGVVYLPKSMPNDVDIPDLPLEAEFEEDEEEEDE